MGRSVWILIALAGSPVLAPRAAGAAEAPAPSQEQKEALANLEQDLWEQGYSEAEIKQQVDARLNQMQGGGAKPSAEPGTGEGDREVKGLLDEARKMVDQDRISPEQAEQFCSGLRQRLEDDPGDLRSMLDKARERLRMMETAYRIRKQMEDRGILPERPEDPDDEAGMPPPSQDDFSDDEIEEIVEELIEKTGE